MVSALLMWRLLHSAIRHALREEDFGPILIAGLLLIATGTVAYTLANGWALIDGLYFAVATLTTSSVADPDLVLTDPWMKIFTVFYILIGIGILVEIVRRIGRGFVAVQHEHRQAKTGTPKSQA